MDGESGYGTGHGDAATGMIGEPDDSSEASGLRDGVDALLTATYAMREVSSRAAASAIRRGDEIDSILAEIHAVRRSAGPRPAR